jgi:hypothetical protein
MSLFISTSPRTMDFTVVPIVFSYFLQATPTSREPRGALKWLAVRMINLNTKNYEFNTNISSFFIMSLLFHPAPMSVLLPQCLFLDLNHVCSKFSLNIFTYSGICKCMCRHIRR